MYQRLSSKAADHSKTEAFKKFPNKNRHINSVFHFTLQTEKLRQIEKNVIQPHETISIKTY